MENLDNKYMELIGVEKIYDFHKDKIIYLELTLKNIKEDNTFELINIEYSFKNQYDMKSKEIHIAMTSRYESFKKYIGKEVSFDDINYFIGFYGSKYYSTNSYPATKLGVQIVGFVMMSFMVSVLSLIIFKNF